MIQFGPTVGTQRRVAGGKTFDVVTVDLGTGSLFATSRTLRPSEARDLAQALIDAAELAERRNAERNDGDGDGA